jgi:hypothetical protein
LFLWFELNFTARSLYSNHFGNEVGVSVAETLKLNNTLTRLKYVFELISIALISLSLSGNHVGVEGGVRLAEALNFNTTLTELG